MRLTIALLVTLPVAALAVGMDDDTPPTPTETTEVCEEGLVWDIATETCMTPEESTNDDSAMRGAVRELAYEGRYADASAVLDTLEPSDPWVLTYRGFIARKTGDWDAALGYYQAALTADPDLLLARSYMGQGYVAEGEFVLARAELSEIRARGGRGTWAEVSLRMALETGVGSGY